MKELQVAQEVEKYLASRQPKSVRLLPQNQLQLMPFQVFVVGSPPRDLCLAVLLYRFYLGNCLHKPGGKGYCRTQKVPVLWLKIYEFHRIFLITAHNRDKISLGTLAFSCDLEKNN